MTNRAPSTSFVTNAWTYHAFLSFRDLSGNNFIILPASINQCCSLRRLVLDRCYQLREINGIPSCVKDLSALNCISLTPQSRSLLSCKKLHEGGGTRFTFPGSRIPNWFNYNCRGSSLCFWFRKKFPLIALCLVFENLEPLFRKEDDIHVRVNGRLIKCIDFPYLKGKWADIHVNLFGLQESLLSDDEAVEECINNRWKHVELTVVSKDFKVKRMAAYVCKRNHDTEDLRFTNYDYFLGGMIRMGALVCKQNHDTEDVRFTSPTASRGVKRKRQSLDSVQNDGPKALRRKPKALRRKSSRPWSAKAFHMLAFHNIWT
ncbi:hypothetical protein L6164_001410 [Bauhinia variegata]|uniref:Uncharacterized protein n=1 Tax=Bauhinia variegata TaxID=167791 RepID=A0ACB9Q9N4_BAUVA|nr:hypothetical protein L6164_001410 [Bauhinia variegata]